MKKFDTPQINVVKFMNDDVITTSNTGGYSGNVTNNDLSNLFGFTTQSATDQDTDFPF